MTVPPTELALPLSPQTVEETGLTREQLTGLSLKILHRRGTTTGMSLAASLRLPNAIVIEVLKEMRQHGLAIVMGSRGTVSMDLSFAYDLTDHGRQLAQRLLDQDPYWGVAPVTLSDYCEMVQHQSRMARRVTMEEMRAAFNDMVVSDQILRRLGAACSSASSLLLYGAPGNGKTMTAQRLARIGQTAIAAPYAVATDEQVIRYYDPVVHHRATPEDGGVSDEDMKRYDERWLIIRRPFVMARSELTLEDLDIRVDPASGVHLAPLQMLANGGTLLIDDFGRQTVSPAAVLNRWIVPLEQRVDHYTLDSGRTIEVPFDPLLVLSTNLSPADLVDEAFLRRIRYKVEVPSPTEEQYRQIFRMVCEEHDVRYDEELVDYLLNYHYFEMRRELRACHPRDLVTQCLSLAQFEGGPLELTRQSIDEACRTYFVEA